MKPSMSNPEDANGVVLNSQSPICSHNNRTEEHETHRSNLHSLSTSPHDVLSTAGKASRKVSFSDVVITSCRVEKPDVLSDTSRVFCEQVSVEERRCESPVDGATNHILVRLIESTHEEAIRDTPLAATSLPVYEVKLGMLKQATIYRMEFEVPDNLPPGEIELIRYLADTPGQLCAPVNVGAMMELESCDPLASGLGHRMILLVSTTKQHRVNEFFTMRLVHNQALAVHLLIHGLSLGRGQGTPFLRLGIHRIGENPDYQDSDEFTEWPGFTNSVDEENESDMPPDGVKVNQGDQSESDTFAV